MNDIRIAGTIALLLAGAYLIYILVRYVKLWTSYDELYNAYAVLSKKFTIDNVNSIQKRYSQIVDDYNQLSKEYNELRNKYLKYKYRFSVDEILKSARLEEAIKIGIHYAHPDNGGNIEDFTKLTDMLDFIRTFKSK